MSDLLDVSIRIGNSYNSEKITPGKTYDFRVNKNTRIKNLKDIFYECIISENGNTEEIKKEINNYELYTKNVIRLYDENEVIDTLQSYETINEIIFYAIKF